MCPLVAQYRPAASRRVSASSYGSSKASWLVKIGRPGSRAAARLAAVPTDCMCARIIRCGSVVRASRLEARAIDDVAAIRGQGQPMVTFGIGAARLGELPGDPRHLDQRSARDRQEPRGHRVEQPDDPRDLLGDRIVEALGAIAALEQEAAVLDQPRDRAAQPRRLGSTAMTGAACARRASTAASAAASA